MSTGQVSIGVTGVPQSIGAAALSPTQVKVLKLLATVPNGLTRQEIESKVDSFVGADNLGPTHTDDLNRHRDSLHAKGYIKPVWLEENTPARWMITNAGKKIAASVKSRAYIKAVIPPNVLDPVVIAFRPTRTYTIELYTAEDMAEIKEALGDGYADVPVEDIRQQIINRRKTGKYKTVVSTPEWYTAYRSGQHWTALIEEMTEHSGCAVNPEHKDGVSVYHRRFVRGGESVINRETPKDLIVLCESCRKKLNGNLPVVPVEQP